MVVYLYLYMASQNSRRKVFQALLRFVCTYHEIKFTRKADFEIERTTKEAAVDSPSIFIKKDWTDIFTQIMVLSFICKLFSRS